MAWNKIRSGVVTGAIVLSLAGVAVLVQHQASQRANARPRFVAGFEPMAGEWEGIFESRGNGLPNLVRQAVALSIHTTQKGRSCEIVMRISVPGRGATAEYRFTHSLNRSGDRISTLDDPQIGHLAGEGVITESIDNRNAGEWRAACRTPHWNGDGFTECRWICKGDELMIARHDRITAPPGGSDLFSDLKLHRRAELK